MQFILLPNMPHLLLMQQLQLAPRIPQDTHTHEGKLESKLEKTNANLARHMPRFSAANTLFQVIQECAPTMTCPNI